MLTIFAALGDLVLHRPRQERLRDSLQRELVDTQAP